MPGAAPHVLEHLKLPARYEKLEEILGPDVVKLLTPPEETIDSLHRISLLCSQTGEGLLVPCYGETGAGKTTLAENLSFFLPNQYSGTVTHQGAISYEALNDAVTLFRQQHRPPRGQIIPINIDHREGAPPSDEELAAVKRYLRTAEIPAVVLWLETDRGRAEALAARYRGITGDAIVELPIAIRGPERSTWQDIALNTIELCNPLPSTQVLEMGINPRDYRPEDFPSLGEFLKRVAIDFSNLVADHQASTRKPVTLIIVFASEALDRGTLPAYTLGGEPGLLDSHALLKCTPESMTGQRWSQKRGILTQTIFRLDARAFWMPPAAIIAVLRRHGPKEVQEVLERLGRTTPSPADIVTYLGRTDLGRYLAEVKGAAYELRGRPAEEAKEMLASVAREYGYGRGNDKYLNASFLEAWKEYFEGIGVQVQEAKAERALEFCASIIPDNQIDLGSRIICIEYVWRSGDVLHSSRRSEAAQYALEKLHNYAVNLGWTTA